MPDLGRKYTCYSCHTKFYDLGKPVPLCPKCGADQRDAEDTPVVTTPRRGRVAPPPPVVEEPVDDADFSAEEAGPGPGPEVEEEEEFVAPEHEEGAEEEDEDEEEEF
jgi:hypothetical protein